MTGKKKKTSLLILLLFLMINALSSAGISHSILFQISHSRLIYDKTFLRKMTVDAGSGNMAGVRGWERQPDFHYQFKGTRLMGKRSSDGIWKISERRGPGRCSFKPENVKVTSGHSGRVNSLLRLCVPAGKKEGGELVSIKNNYHFGIYEIRMKPSGVPGSVNAFFIINPYKRSEEIDIEFLTDEFRRGSGKVHFVVHPRSSLLPPTYHKIAVLNFNPADDFHSYGFVWTRKKIDFFIDGNIVCSFSAEEGSPVKSGTGSIHINTWTGNPGWGGGPPARDSWMTVERISYWKG